MPFMTRIPSDLARFGLKVELAPGWATRGSSSFAPACVVDHWTAGPRGTKGRPSLNVCINGRPGIPGPLCNIYLARDGTCVVVAAGRANHAGTGGFRGLVGNSAAYGIEAECAGDGDWTSAMLDAYPRLNAALLSGLGRDASWLCDHATWAPGRKIDIRDVIGRVRADTARHLAGGSAPAQQEDEMNPYQDAVLMEVLDRVKAVTFPKPGKPHAVSNYMPQDSLRTEAIAAAIPRLEAQLTGLQAAVNTLAGAVAKGGGVSAEEIKAAVADAIEEGVVKVEVAVQGRAQD